MKKILGVSFAAMLAVSPMLANAAVTATATTMSEKTASANTQIATTSYVKGAYNAVATEHNKVKADIDNIVTDINVTAAQQVVGGVVTSGNSVAQNLVALDNAVKNAASSASTTYQLQQNSNVESTGEGDLHYITTGTGVAANLKALDDQVATNAGAISAEASRAAAAEDALDTRLTTAEGGISTLQSDKQDKSASTVAEGTHNYITAGNGVANNLVALDNQLKTVSNTVANYSTDLSGKQDVSASTVAEGTHNYITAGNGVANNLVALDTAVKNATDAASANTAAIAAINNKVLAVYGTWDSENSTGTVQLTTPAQGSGNN